MDEWTKRTQDRFTALDAVLGGSWAQDFVHTFFLIEQAEDEARQWIEWSLDLFERSLRTTDIATTRRLVIGSLEALRYAPGAKRKFKRRFGVR